MAVQQFLGGIEIDARPDGHQIIFGHHLGDLAIKPSFEAQITIGENADELALLRHRQTGNAILIHDLLSVGNLLIGRDGNRIADHAAFEFFDFFDFRGLGPD